MGKIKVLSPEVYSQIKAGEVIERPASIVSELLDNALDSGADEITVKIEDGGLKKITVIDNGCGIDKEDLPLAFAMHSTSKISRAEDLFDIRTMGFRDEALYSIQTIAKIYIASKSIEKKDKSGFSYSNFGSDALKVIPAAVSEGTKVEVSDIFYNIPVRKKFLKSIYTEWNNIKKICIMKAMANRSISFKVYHNNEFIFSTNKDNNFGKNFFQIYSNENSFEINNYKKIVNERLSVELFYSGEDLFFSTRKYQMLFVNKRAITANFFYPAIESGYRNYISPGRYPLIYMFLDLAPQDIDVNIHPAKKEIKFLNQDEIFAVIQKTVSEAYNRIIKNKYFIPDNDEIKFSENGLKLKDNSKKYSEDYFNEVVFKENNNIIRPVQKFDNDYNIIGSVFDTYILIEKDDRIIFIDQHAACEAIIYKNKKEKYEKNHASEVLLLPISFEANKSNKKIINKINALNKELFVIENSSGDSYLIREIPSVLLSNKDYGEVHDIILDFLENDYDEKISIIDSILIRASCREAVKKGDKLSMLEIAEITDDYFKNNITNCPHGRPVSFELSKDYFEKIFQRKK